MAAIPGWSSLSLDGNMIEFMSDWDRARRYLKREENVLDLGISYSYDSTSNADSLQLKNGKPLMLKESSSGVQSLLPMFVHLDYLTHGQYEDSTRKISYEQKEERKNLLSTIYSKLYKKKLKDEDSREVLTMTSNTMFVSFPFRRCTRYTTMVWICSSTLNCTYEAEKAVGRDARVLC